MFMPVLVAKFTPPIRYSFTSPLQNMILKTICTSKNTGYMSLQTKIKRDQVTTRQAVVSLQNYDLIYVDQHEHSIKLDFMPTAKGIAMAVVFLQVPYEKIVQTHGIEDKKNKQFRFDNKTEEEIRGLLVDIRDSIDSMTKTIDSTLLVLEH